MTRFMKKILIGVSILLTLGLIFGFTTSTVFTWIVRTTFLNYGSDYDVPQSVASAAGLILPDAGTTFNITGTANVTRIASPTYPGAVGSTSARVVILRSASTDTLTDGVNLKLAGNFNGTADDVIILKYNITGADTFWSEVSRSAN